MHRNLEQQQQQQQQQQKPRETTVQKSFGLSLSQFNLPNQTPSWNLDWLLEPGPPGKPGGPALGAPLQLRLFLGTGTSACAATTNSYN